MSKKIPLLTSILMCINSIIGAGLFINLITLTQRCGSLGFFIYFIGAILLIPFIICLTKLGSIHPVTGGLYTYAKTYLNKDMGFLSSWSYFLSKATSAALLTHIFSRYLQFNILALESVPTIILDVTIISLLTLLCIGGLKTSGLAQYLCAALKGLPILFAMVAGAFLYKNQNMEFFVFSTQQIIKAIPTALFAIVGFEITTSISGLLSKPKKTLPQTIILSFIVVVASAITLQFFVFGALGSTLLEIETPLIELGTRLGGIGIIAGQYANYFFFTSVIGTVCAIIASNSWNLHALAEHDHLPLKKSLTSINTNHAPIISLLAHCLVSCIIILISNNIMALQNMSVFALFVSYTITSLAAYKAHLKKAIDLSPSIICLSITICSMITILALSNICTFGISFSFLSIFLLGCTFSIIKKF